MQNNQLFVAEVSFQQAGKCFAMASFVACHFMYGVMDCVEVERFCTFCKISLAGSCAILSFNTHLKVLLGGVGYDFAQQLSKFCSMFCFFVSSFLPVQADFRIAFAMCNACHCQVHTDLAALAIEVSAQIVDDILRNTLCYADNMLRSPGHFFGLLNKLGSGSAADGTFLRSGFAFMNITTDAANKFFHIRYILSVT